MLFRSAYDIAGAERSGKRGGKRGEGRKVHPCVVRLTEREFQCVDKISLWKMQFYGKINVCSEQENEKR